ncbi:hypothetical protein JDV02_010099 [Purpureocillium takamizusanense]|uniref:C2H2-type domain-containing protein n=1 Tax=Purpureocillium takamizusanense TaxID=2060973 RepID=A0A9Q8VH26_9HYPO|nr:uncharacterized protein JDV02_010099 [Purpureocillium takamizusanense]UNI24347.1 hypothetical protein JDV02_010099 [Purpureocillium takamizusanense]
MDDAAVSNHLSKRGMSNAAIGGTVAGVVVAVGLLLLCLYPFIVNCWKRHRRNGRADLDTEAGRPPGPGNAPGADLGSQPRLSSSESLKRDGDVPRDEYNATRGNEAGWPSRDGPPARLGVDATTREVTSRSGAATSDRSLEVDAGEHELQMPPFAYPYGIEYMPESEVQDNNTGVLKGTSADYYSPSIPSEAFGMVTTPTDHDVDTSQTRPSGSRSSSLRYNVRHMFRRKSGRDNTIDSFTTLTAAGGATSLQQIITNEDPTESPTEVTVELALPEPKQLASASNASTPLPNAAETTIKHSSPPEHPAPGTVNPMDIMPASTESELWYRTEQQLLASSYQSVAVAPLEQSPETGYTQTVTAPSPTNPAQSPVEQAADLSMAADAHLEVGDHDVPMPDGDAHDHISPSAVLESHRHPSYPSDQSTPFPEHSSTNPSSHNTPSTQVDSPSSASMNSSDYRHSVSPQPVLLSLKTGVFRCTEVGCNQVFDQPHKLKHHQRYHSKDHKCEYPNCGKGFGTKTHLQRHINDRHEKKKKFHCSVPNCDFSRVGGRAFPRKDNWKRHMMKIHHMDQTQLPEPIEVDQDAP